MKGEEKVIENDEKFKDFVAKRLDARDAKWRRMAEENLPEAMEESVVRPSPW